MGSKDTDACITVHPDLCNGRPTIRGLRITVETIIGFLSAGESPEEILRQYPSLEPADIDACIAFVLDLQSRRGELVGLSDASTKQCDIADLFGKVQLDPDYDYKSLRQAASVPPR
ncbi:MAG: DUF433 domain-containing protein [Thiocapsa sp.]|nr:MAG: DUF433 domain-containing protein [Thiocapsa sp.]